MPKQSTRSQARQMLASLQSFSVYSGSSTIFRQFFSSKFCSQRLPRLMASQRQADQAPGSTFRYLKKDSKFLSNICEKLYSNSWALWAEKRWWNPFRNFTKKMPMHESSLEKMNLTTKKMVEITGRGEQISQSGYFLLAELASTFVVWLKEDSELLTSMSKVMKPETPPNFSSLSKASMNLMRPVSYGSVPTSIRVQNSGFKSRQKPSKNQRWEDNFLALRCLKQAMILRSGSSGSMLPRLYRCYSSLEGFHSNWQSRLMFLATLGGMPPFFYVKLDSPLLSSSSISLSISLMRETNLHSLLPELQSIFSKNLTEEDILRCSLSVTSLRMPSWMMTTAISLADMPLSFTNLRKFRYIPISVLSRNSMAGLMGEYVRCTWSHR